MKRLVFIFALLVMVFTGCSGKSAKNEDRTDMDFTVVPREDMPDEIKGIIEEKTVRRIYHVLWHGRISVYNAGIWHHAHRRIQYKGRQSCGNVG